MLAELFRGGGKAQDFLGRDAVERDDLIDDRLAARDGAGLVEDDGVDLFGVLERRRCRAAGCRAALPAPFRPSAPPAPRAPVHTGKR
jgi:hypothetical protein